MRITDERGAFFGDPAIKAKYVARVEAHRMADEITQGIGWDGTKGCAVGCTFDNYSHESFLAELNIDPAIGHLVDFIHEHLSREQSLIWPGRFLAAIRPGADIEGSMVSQRFVLFLVRDSIGVVDHEVTNQLLTDCAALYQRWIDGDKPSRTGFSALAALAARAALAALADLAALAALAYRADRAATYANKLVELLEAA